MKNFPSLENLKFWSLPEGTLIHIARMLYETVGEVKISGFHAPEKIQKHGFTSKDDIQAIED